MAKRPLDIVFYGLADASGLPVTRIGRIDALPGLRLVDAQGAPVVQHFAAFDHFRPVQPTHTPTP